MRIRALPLAMLAALVVPTTGSAPTVLKYKITQTFEQTIDLTALGQDPQSSQTKYDIFVTATSQDSAGGHALAIKVDSVVADPSGDAALATALTSQIKDAAGSGFVDGAGKVSGFAESAGIKNLAQAVYPELKSGAKPGDTWADTTSQVDSMQGGTMNRKTITNFTASAGDSWKGQSTLKLAGQSSYSVDGAQNGASFNGNGHATINLTVSRAGHTISGQNASELDLMATSPQAPMPIPITNKTSSAVTLLP